MRLSLCLLGLVIYLTTQMVPVFAMERVILPQWRFEPGPYNAITDVSGVEVGHVTIQKESPHRIRTGVTAIVPHSGNLALTGLWASGRMLNGNGELTGLDYIQQSGILNSPIILTNTYAVGTADTGVFDYYAKHYGTSWPGALPVVGECYDGVFNTIEDRSAVSPQDVVTAIETAQSGPVPQGRVGAGTGMRSFELHAGIGSASRRIQLGNTWYTVGVLVNMNHSRLADLDPTIRSVLEKALHHTLADLKAQDDLDRVKRAPGSDGSIMIVIATDLPLLPHELSLLVDRAALGIGQLGSTMAMSSGDGVIAFSTATQIPLDSAEPISMSAIHPEQLTPVFRATIEAVTEAQINALLASHLSSR